MVRRPGGDGISRRQEGRADEALRFSVQSDPRSEAHTPKANSRASDWLLNDDITLF